MTADGRALEQRMTVEVVKLLSDSASEPRLAMRGASMLPLLREPMLLKLGPSGSDDHIGDIVVFEREGSLVAHRITALRDGTIQTCGDARPWSPEYPERSAIIGKVVAVLESDGPDAPRVDTTWFRLRGSYKARFRAVRAIPFLAWLFARRVAAALPWLRRRPYVALVQAMSALVRDDKTAFQRALSREDPAAIVAVARRHACSATLVEAAATLGGNTEASKIVQRSLQEAGRNVVLRGLAVKEQVRAVVAMLADAGLPFALLKGAARLYSGDSSAMLQPSSDLDILVPAENLDAVASALRAHGYEERSSESKRKNYLEHHHHAAPLFPPAGGCAIELHVALAPPGNLSLASDWAALESHMMWVEGPAGPARCLDDLGSALHYAVHCVGLTRLRDSVLLAQLLRRMQPEQYAQLQHIVKSETTDPIRLDGAVALAARMAGIPWPVSGEVEEYLRWTTRREDEPIYFGQRSQLPEGWYAGGRGMTTLMWRLVDPRSMLSDDPGRLPAPLALMGRIFTGLVAYAYAWAMKAAA